MASRQMKNDRRESSTERAMITQRGKTRPLKVSPMSESEFGTTKQYNSPMSRMGVMPARDGKGNLRHDAPMDQSGNRQGARRVVGEAAPNVRSAFLKQQMTGEPGARMVKPSPSSPSSGMGGPKIRPAITGAARLYTANDVEDEAVSGKRRR